MVIGDFKMTLLEWKKKNGYRFEDVNFILTMKYNGHWSIHMIKKVFYRTAKPGRDLLLALKELTGLSDKEILGG